jgi:ATP-dependent 26S proteasome regulatory subunit
MGTGKSKPNGIDTLTPTQTSTIGRMMDLWETSNTFCLWARSGMGRSTMLKFLSKELKNSSILSARDWFEPLLGRHPMQIEETFVEKALQTLETSDVLLVDDFDRFMCVTSECNHFYPRSGLVRSATLTLLDAAQANQRKVVFTGDWQVGDTIQPRALFFGFKTFDQSDYEFLIRRYLGKKAKGIDVNRVYCFAPKLTAHQLRGCLDVLRAWPTVKTEDIIDYLERLKMASNVDVGQVRKVTLNDLKGVDDILASLNRYVVNPIVEVERSRAYNLRPKRGILLYGPPGTGKTTVGRALAGQLRSKFFKIDGTIIAGTEDFYAKIDQVFEAAKENAPSIVFIDDCDTLFLESDNAGLYRYLLTLLDGIETENMGGVTVLMTAMNAADLPPALIRSGRIELWLKMTKPNTHARKEILESRVRSLPVKRRPRDLSKIADATEGFTGADLERLVEDAKAVMLEEDVAGRLGDDTTDCFLTAVEEIRSNVTAMEEAALSADVRTRNNPSDPFARIAGMFAERDSEDSPASL